MNMLCYQKSLLNAASSHPLEQEDLNLWISQIDSLLLELFKSKSLDNTDYMLQLLLPSVLFFSFYFYHEYCSYFL